MKIAKVRIAWTALMFLVAEVAVGGGIEMVGGRYDENHNKNIYNLGIDLSDDELKFDLKLKMLLDSQPNYPLGVKFNADKTIVGFTGSPCRNTYNIVLIELREDGSLVVFPHFTEQVIQLLKDNHVAFENPAYAFYLKAMEDSKGGTVLDIRSFGEERYFKPLNLKLVIRRDGKMTIASIERPK